MAFHGPARVGIIEMQMDCPRLIVCRKHFNGGGAYHITNLIDLCLNNGPVPGSYHFPTLFNSFQPSVILVAQRQPMNT